MNTPEEKTQSFYVPPVPLNGMSRVFVITGLPGSGKTSVASAIAKRLKAVHLNADEVRATVNARLGFTKADRLEQARSMGHMARWAGDAGYVVVDFVCPDFDTRHAFMSAVGEHKETLRWIEIERPDIVSRFEGTRKMYEPLHSSPFLSFLHIPKFMLLRNKDKELEEVIDEAYQFFKE